MFNIPVIDITSTIKHYRFDVSASITEAKAKAYVSITSKHTKVDGSVPTTATATNVDGK